MKPNLAKVTLCLATLAGLGLMFVRNGVWPHSKSEANQTASAPVLAPRDSREKMGLVLAAVPHGTSPRSGAAKADWSQLQAGMHDLNPYGAYTKLKEARQPGSYAHAWAIRNHCGFVALSARFAEASGFDDAKLADGASASGPELLAARQRAALDAKARCEVLMDPESAERPYPDDVNGQRYMQAIQRLGATRAGFPRAELRVLAEQGALYEVSSYLRASTDGPPRYFEGQRFAETANDRDIYNRAIGLATFYAIDGGNVESAGISQLELCIDFGRCAGRRPEDLALADLPPDSKVRAQVMALYPRILAAYMNGDVEAFAPPPQGSASARQR